MGSISNLASKGPPEPDGFIPTPPGFPIDQYLFILTFVGVFYGFYVKYKSKKYKSN